MIAWWRRDGRETALAFFVLAALIAYFLASARTL